MCMMFLFFFFNDTATTEIYTLSLHDALPIYVLGEGIDEGPGDVLVHVHPLGRDAGLPGVAEPRHLDLGRRSEEHTSELQSRQYLVCRLLLEKKNKHLYTS